MERNGVLAPRTHDLNFLARQLVLPTAEVGDVALINPTFDQVRYPDPVSLAAPVDSTSPALAAQHLACAGRPARHERGEDPGMDRHATALSGLHIEPVVQRFAHLLQQESGAERVLLFGSRARGDARMDSDYDVIVVSPTFAGIEPARRGVGLWEVWYRAGANAPLDLKCVTPDEFALARTRISLIAEVLPEAIDVLAGRWATDETPDEVPTH